MSQHIHHQKLAYLAVKMEVQDDAIELGLSTPMGGALEVITSDPEEVYNMTRCVVENVKIPVIVKLSQNASNLSTVAKAVKRAGGSGYPLLMQSDVFLE